MMALQTKPWSQWTYLERDVLWNIANDPVFQGLTWEVKAKQFNARVRELLPYARERTASAVYLQWKSIKDAQAKAMENVNHNLPVSNNSNAGNACANLAAVGSYPAFSVSAASRSRLRPR